VRAAWTLLLCTLIAVTASAAPLAVDRVEGALALRASLNKAVFAPGEPVEITLVGRNRGTAPLAVTFPSGQHHDVIVRRRGGREVWRWSHDKAFIQVVQTVVLRPQEARTYRVAWDQRDLRGRRVAPGAYEVVAVFLGRVGDGGAPLALPPLAFTVTR